jgi:transcriptional regulator with XRE-family HTH domain
MDKPIFTSDHKYTVNQLKKARSEANLSQIEAADLLGKTQSHISKVEAGQRKIDVVTLKEFARIYRKPLDYFIK